MLTTAAPRLTLTERGRIRAVLATLDARRDSLTADQRAESRELGSRRISLRLTKEGHTAW